MKVRARSIYQAHTRINLLVTLFERECEDNGWDRALVRIPGIPKSLNHQYRRGRCGNVFLHEEVKNWRDTARLAIYRMRPQVKFHRLVNGVIIFRSPKWVTQKSTVAMLDADNRTKPVLDAIKRDPKASHLPYLIEDDSLLWEWYTAKQLADQEETLVYLYDAGDIVDRVNVR